MEFRRRLYRRGSSFETTVPMPLLLTMDMTQKQDVIFSYDQEKQTWTIRFEPTTREQRKEQRTEHRTEQKTRQQTEQRTRQQENTTGQKATMDRRDAEKYE